MPAPPDLAVVANHYQNENCHPDGKVRLGMAEDAPWRWERLDNAKRLFAGARRAGLPLIHVRLAVTPDYRGVIANSPMVRQWIELGAWKEGSWGAEFMEGLDPEAGEHVVTHTRNSAFRDSTLPEILFLLGVRRLVCCGVSTTYVVESTVREAADIGYEVTVASDACATGSDALHRNSLAALQPLAAIRTVDEILAEWNA